MFDMLADGYTCNKIARTLNEASVPTKSGKRWEGETVSRIVHNPAYCGITYFGQTIFEKGKRIRLNPDKWTILPDATPAIISRESFEQVQTALSKSSELHSGKAKHEYPLTGFTVCGYCGSPLVGCCLKGKYRYYHCRGTYTTASRKKICDARYVKADWLETAVWDNVKVVLSQPELLLSEMRKRTDAEQSQVASGTLEQEIRDLTRKMKGYAGQERRLMNVLRLNVATPDIVLDELNQMKKEHDADEKKLASLTQTKESIAKASDMEANLKTLCSQIAPDLDNCKNGDKKNAFKYLDLHIKATSEGADIKGYLDPSVLIASQSSGYLLSCTYNFPSGLETAELISR
jgi:site-specific DNA recombinase